MASQPSDPPSHSLHQSYSISASHYKHVTRFLATMPVATPFFLVDTLQAELTRSVCHFINQSRGNYKCSNLSVHRSPQQLTLCQRVRRRGLEDATVCKVFNPLPLVTKKEQNHRHTNDSSAFPTQLSMKIHKACFVGKSGWEYLSHFPSR